MSTPESMFTRASAGALSRATPANCSRATPANRSRATPANRSRATPANHARSGNRSRAARLAAALFCAVLVLPAQAAAQAPQPPPNHPGYAFGHPGGEALLFLAAGLSNLTSYLPQRKTDWAPAEPHAHDRTADRISDVTGAYGGAAIGALAGFGLEAGYFGESGVRGGVLYAARTSLVDVESLLFTRGVVDTLKRLTGRCRPRYFEKNACTSDVRDAFPSGHTAPMGALAGARLLLSAQSTGPAGYRWGSFALAETMAITTAFLRVRAGMHSWSDVGAGLVIGHAIGLLVAFAHPMQPVPSNDLRPRDGTTSQDGFGLSWGGTF